MGFQLSAGVNFNEKDISNFVAAVATTDAALAGVFRWGPVGKEIVSDSEVAFATSFGPPTNFNAETWFTGANFLAYSSALHTVRAANTTGQSPLVTGATVQTGNGTILVSSTNTLSSNLSYYVLGVANSTGGASAAVRPSALVTVVNSTALSLVTSSDALSGLTGGRIQLVTNSAFTAVANSGFVPSLAGQIARNDDEFTTKTDYDANTVATARYPGDMGNSLRMSVCGNTSGFQSTIALNTGTYGNTLSHVDFIVNSNTATAVLFTTDNTTIGTVSSQLITDLNLGDKVQVGNSSIGYQVMKISALGTPNTAGSNSTHGVASVLISFEDNYRLSSNVTFLGTDAISNTITRYWEFYNLVDKAPSLSDYQINFGNNSVGSDEMHVVVIDENGKFSGIPGTVLEVYKNVSRATDSQTTDGSTNFYKNIINKSSKYIYFVNSITGAASNTAENLTASTLDVLSYNFNYGANGPDEVNIPMGDLARAYDKFGAETGTDISLVLTGKSSDGALGYQLANYLIDNISESRRDCVVFISPPKTSVVNNLGNEADDVVSFFNNVRSTSYAVFDSGYKYQYDKYNDIFRWIPLNGDIAGLAARTDQTNDPWWSPAGLNRGQIKNVAQLAYNPRKTDRDNLYKNRVNPVITLPGQGTVLYGDKTALAKASAFNHINVRRLFIVLEKAITAAAQRTLFEFNDEFTRSQFKSMIVPYLRDVQGRRGVIAYDVKCDTDNNTSQVINTYGFVGDIYIIPARSINNVTLNFIAVADGVSFAEIEGKTG